MISDGTFCTKPRMTVEQLQILKRKWKRKKFSKQNTSHLVTT